MSLGQIWRQLSVPKAFREPDLNEALRSAADGGRIARWPPYGRIKDRFWHKDPAAVIEELTGDRAMVRDEIGREMGRRGLLAKSATQPIIRGMLAAGRLAEYPPLGVRRAKVLAPPNRPKAYLAAASDPLEAIFEKLRRAANSDAEILAFLSAQLGRRAGPANLADRIYEAMLALESQKGLPVYVGKIRARSEFQEASKEEFDRAALSLWHGRRVHLSRHDDPYNLTEEERHELVSGGEENYYVAIAWRED